MNINWQVRLKSKQFWVGLIGALGVAATSIATALGVEIDVAGAEGVANSVVTAVFTVLALAGVVADPTTSGMSDSAQAMTYTSPKKDGAGQAE